MLRILAAIMLVLGMAGPAQARLNVVTSVPDLAAIAQAVGGSEVNVRSMALSTQDPHFVDARPNLALALNKADLLIVVGAQLEVGWLPVLQRGARNPDVLTGRKGHLDCSTQVELQETATGRVDRSQGDIHPEGNPHYLRDPRNGILCAQAIAARLSELKPSQAEAFQANFLTFRQQMLKKIDEWERLLADRKGSPVLVYHHSWPYLTEWLELRQVGSVEPRPGIPPSPAHVAKLVGDSARLNPQALLQEEYYPSDTPMLISRRTGAKFLRLQGGTRFEKGESYEQYIGALINALAGALKPGDAGSK